MVVIELGTNKSSYLWFDNITCNNCLHWAICARALDGCWGDCLSMVGSSVRYRQPEILRHQWWTRWLAVSGVCFRVCSILNFWCRVKLGLGDMPLCRNLQIKNLTKIHSAHSTVSSMLHECQLSSMHGPWWVDSGSWAPRWGQLCLAKWSSSSFHMFNLSVCAKVNLSVTTNVSLCRWVGGCVKDASCMCYNFQVLVNILSKSKSLRFNLG